MDGETEEIVEKTTNETSKTDEKKEEIQQKEELERKSWRNLAKLYSFEKTINYLSCVLRVEQMKKYRLGKEVQFYRKYLYSQAGDHSPDSVIFTDEDEGNLSHSLEKTIDLLASLLRQEQVKTISLEKKVKSYHRRFRRLYSQAGDDSSSSDSVEDEVKWPDDEWMNDVFGFGSEN